MRAKKKARNEGRPGYKKTKVGWIPEEWECVRIRDVAKVITGSTPSTKKPEYYGSKFLFVGPADLDNGKYVVDSAKKLSMTGFNICRKIPAGSTLFTCIGSTIGKVAIAGEDLATNQQINAVISNNKDTKEFLYYALLKLSPRIKSLASEQAVPIVNKSEFSAYRIPLPPLSEQKKIAEILSAWDRAIEQVGKLIDAKERLKKGLMQQLLTGRMRFPQFRSANERVKTHFYDLPLDWKHPRISEIAREVSEKNVEQIDYPVLSCCKYDGFVNSLEYFGKKVYSDDTSNYKIIKRGQFGFPSNHIEEGSIGLLNHVDAGIVSPIYTIFEMNPEKVFAPYLYALFKTDTYQHVFRVNTNSSVDRRGSLRWQEFSKIRVPLPSLAEQTRIASVLSSCDREIELLKKKLEKLKEQKKGLMQKLLTGEIRVKEVGSE